MILPLSMSIAGSIPLIACIVLWIIQTNSFHVKRGILLLKISMFFYLVPIQLLYHVIPNSIYFFFVPDEPTPILDKPIRFYYYREQIILHNEKYIWIPVWQIILLLVWLACVLCFAAFETIKYRKAIKSLRLLSVLANSDTNEKEPYLLVVPDGKSPYTIGFFKPYIIFSKDDYESQYKTMLYQHELCHTRNHDALIKLLCLIIICIHWYNPVVWLLLFMYSLLCEFACDSYVTEKLTFVQRKMYAELLVEYTYSNRSLPVIWRNNFSNTEKIIKRRILYFMKPKKLSLIKNFLSILLITVTIIGSCSTIFAYEPLKTTTWDPRVEIGDEKYMELYPEGYHDEYWDPVLEYADFSQSDVILQLNDGTQLSSNPHSSAKISCVHNWALGYKSKHISNSSGGCSIRRYKVTVCSICNTVKNQTYENTISFEKCPHK